MFEQDLNKFILGGEEYPYKCDLYVMEKVQDDVGDIVVAEDLLRGFVPRVDADGVVDRTDGRWTIPNINLVCKLLVWMMEEGREIIGGDYNIPSEMDLKRQDEYTATQLAVIAFAEFENCISGKKKTGKKVTTKKRTATKTANTKR